LMHACVHLLEACLWWAVCLCAAWEFWQATRVPPQFPLALLLHSALPACLPPLPLQGIGYGIAEYVNCLGLGWWGVEGGGGREGGKFEWELPCHVVTGCCPWVTWQAPWQGGVQGGHRGLERGECPGLFLPALADVLCVRAGWVGDFGC
jgi:hypothetical protein